MDMSKLTALAQFDESRVIRPTDPYYPYTDLSSRLSLLKDTSQDVIENPNFWSELPDSIRSNILSWVDNLLQTLELIAEHRDDPNWLSSNYSSTQSQVIGYYDSLYQPFIVGMREFKSSATTDRATLAAELQRVRKALKDVEKKRELLEDVTSQAAELNSIESSNRLSQFFDYLTSGFPRQPKPKDAKWLQAIVWWIKTQFHATWAAERGHIASARAWFAAVIASIALTGFVAHKALEGVDLAKITVPEVLARALLVAAPAYAIRFSTRNFNAHKHQIVINRHRAVVLDTLLPLVGRQDISAPTREQLIIEATKHVFEPGESGFLSRRDSVGNSDPVFEIPWQTKP
jgi:hypothetical protein